MTQHPIAKLDCSQIRRGSPSCVRYATASIDEARRTVGITVVVDYRMPSLAARATGLARRASEQRFLHFIALSNAGLRAYWSRTIVLDGVHYTVEVSAKQSPKGMPLVLADIGSSLLGPLASRSRNPYPLLLGNLYYEPWHDRDGDAMFAMTAAHEIGHAFLTSAFGIRWSWGHQGTSSLWGGMGRCATPYPPAGEIELMRYYRHDPAAPVYRHEVLARTIAGENDVKTLLYIAARAAAGAQVDAPGG